ncbi:dinuclear metal center protein, YbgI/SA1388 family [Thiovulum sp. ES]|nr:dinuclear metal center protein, YbgI/SA1388 family [Thiovulum sp. ES]
MKIKDLFEILDEISPFETCEKWDSCGLQIGDMEDEISDVILSLDIDKYVIENAPSGAVIITHHPLIFGNLKSLNFSIYPANLIFEMLQKNLKLISLHTNYDKSILNKYVLRNVLGWRSVEKIENYLLITTIDMELMDFLRHIHSRLNLKEIHASRELPERVKKVALSTGSGSDFISKLPRDVDIFLTGDVKYHKIFEARSLGLGIVDIGHFESEYLFAESLQQELESYNIESEIVNSKNPFKYWKL